MFVRCVNAVHGGLYHSRFEDANAVPVVISARTRARDADIDDDDEFVYLSRAFH